MAGVRFGYALIWALLVSIIATIVLQGMAGRIGLITQNGLVDVVRTELKTTWARNMVIAMVLGAILVGNAAYEAGNIGGATLGLEQLLPQPQLKIFLPAIMVGTTVVPYNLFLHASLVKEKWNSKSDLKAVNWDTIVSIGLGGLVSMAILITASAAPISEINNALDMARALEPLESLLLSQHLWPLPMWPVVVLVGKGACRTKSSKWFGSWYFYAGWYFFLLI